MTFRKKHFYIWCAGLIVHALLTTYIGIYMCILYVHGWYIKQPMYLLFIWGGTKWFINNRYINSYTIKDESNKKMSCFYEGTAYIRSKEFCWCISGYTVTLAAPVEHFARKAFVLPGVNSLTPLSLSLFGLENCWTQIGGVL